MSTLCMHTYILSYINALYIFSYLCIFFSIFIYIYTPYRGHPPLYTGAYSPLGLLNQSSRMLTGFGRLKNGNAYAMHMNLCSTALSNYYILVIRIIQRYSFVTRCSMNFLHFYFKTTCTHRMYPF